MSPWFLKKNLIISETSSWGPPLSTNRGHPPPFLPRFHDQELFASLLVSLARIDEELSC